MNWTIMKTPHSAELGSDSTEQMLALHCASEGIFFRFTKTWQLLSSQSFVQIMKLIPFLLFKFEF